MILAEATIGGVLYLDWIDSEMALPETERVAIEYGTITNKERIDLIHRSSINGLPNPSDIALIAIDGKGKKIRNLKGADGTILDTVQKCLSYNDEKMIISQIIYRIGTSIWLKQLLTDEQQKN
jgi:hypothetical protein